MSASPEGWRLLLRRRLRWVFWRRLTFGGLVGALVFLCLSLTPSLLPRSPFMQGVVSGVTSLIGYGLGNALSSGMRKLLSREPGTHAKKIAWWTLLGFTIVLVPLFLVLGNAWQNDIRHVMGVKDLAEVSGVLILVVGFIVFMLFLFISRAVRGMTRILIRLINKRVPRAVSVPVGVTLAFVIVLGAVQGFILNPALEALNQSFSVTNNGTTEGIVKTTSPLRSGGPGSKVDWSTLGVKGRDFIGGGPTVKEISDFNDDKATEPIRIYVGLKSADSLDERVQLVLDELDRTHAWDREVLAIATTTGTGWVDSNAVDPIEFIHDGNTAIVATQYSYLPSWISFLVDQDKASDAGKATISAIIDRLNKMPEDKQPKLLLFGESLGSFGTEAAFRDLADMTSTADGVLLAGPTFSNHMWTDLVDHRDEGTPIWHPVVDGGKTVRFTADPSGLNVPSQKSWDKTPRVVYLQNATDPISWFSYNLSLHRPEWLDKPRGYDVSPDMHFIPFVTFWQTAADLAVSTNVPSGHGHSYGVNSVDAWAAIDSPKDWTNSDTQRLRDYLNKENDD